jgi:FkbM family methyltransferase
MEDTARRMRWAAGAFERAKHPELSELYLEERRLPLIMRKLLRPNSCGADVGAHVGSFLSLLKRMAPEGKHIAIEPSFVKSRWLKKRFPDIDVFQVAITDNTGWSVFEDNLLNSGLSQLIERADTDVTFHYNVPTKRLDDLIFEQLDLLKLDIEDSELAALKGAANLIATQHPAIIFECGPQCRSRMELYHELTEVHGYHVHSFTDFLFPAKGPLTYDEFRKCGIYPFRALNFVAVHSGG